MKKLRYVMILAVLVVVLAAFCSQSAYLVAFADSDFDTYAAFETLCNDYADRTVGKKGATDAAEWIAAQLASWGYVAEGDSMVCKFTFTSSLSSSLYDTTSETIEACNVVAYKRSGKADASLLVIGAPFDNERNLQYDGAALYYDEALANASSAATLLAVAYSLKDVSLPYDVAFCFFGASFFYYEGTHAFLDSNKHSLLGYIDLYNVAGGDNVNVYYDETSRTHGDYVDAFLARFQYADVHRKPFDPGYTSAEVEPYPYGHVGLGANAVMMAAGVPSIRLFGYNWEEHCESVRFADVIYTEDDTHANALKNYGESVLSARMNYVKEIVRNLVLQRDELQSALSQAAQDKTALSLVSSAAKNAFTYTVVGVVVVAIAIAGVLLMRRSKQAGVPDFSVNSEFINGQNGGRDDDKDDVFAKDGDSIVGDHADLDPSSDKDDFDDIFGEH